MGTYRILQLIVPRAEVELASDALWLCGAQAVEEIQIDSQMVCLRTDLGSEPRKHWAEFLATRPEQDLFAVWSVTQIEIDSGSSDSWRQFAEPTRVANVLIVPNWKRDSLSEDIRDDDVIVYVEPLGSFGIGDHPTTRATLLLALGLMDSGKATSSHSILDLGCGSGVLGIALAKIHRCSVTAIDIAPAAIEATLINLSLNGVETHIQVSLGDVSIAKGHHQLVLANILAPVLLDQADIISKNVELGGSLVLSGFTESRRSDIIDRYVGLGFSFRDEVEIDGWFAVSLAKTSSPN